MANLNIAIEIAAKDSASSIIGGITGALGGLGNLAQGALTVGLGAATAGVAALGAGLGLALNEALDAQTVMAQTAAVIESTGGAAGITADQVSNMAGELAQMSTFSDDAIQQGQNLLLTFTSIGKDTFPTATQAMIDMAAALGTDAKGSAIQLGKALNNPIEGVSALTRVGVVFTEEQKKLIKTLMDTGDVAGAQTVILDELAKEFGGSAAAKAATFSGQLTVLQNNLLDLAEGVGLAFLPLLQELGDRVFPLITAGAADLAANFQAFIASGALDNIVSGFDSLVATVQDNLPLVQATVQSVFDAGQQIFGDMAGFVNDTLMPALASIWEQTGLELPQVKITFEDVMTGVQTAAQTVADFITLTLRPALEGLVQWVVEHWPTIQKVFEDLAAWITGSFVPAVETFAQTLADNKDAILGFFSGLAAVAGAAALIALPALITGLVTGLIAYAAAVWAAAAPTLALAVAWASVLIPLVIIGALVGGLAAYFVSYGEAVLGANADSATFIELLQVGFVAVLLDAYNTLVLIKDLLVLVFITTLAAAATTVDMLQKVIQAWVAGQLTGLYTIWQNISGAIGGVIGNLDKLIASLGNLVIPDWLTPGSPTPFETGLRGITDAMRDLHQTGLPELQTSLAGGGGGSIAPAFSGGGGGGGGGASVSSWQGNLIIDGAQDPQAVANAVARVLEDRGLLASTRLR